MKKKYIKIITPDGTEKLVSDIIFDNGFDVECTDYGVLVSNIFYNGGTDYNFTHNIYNLEECSWQSLLPSPKFNNGLVYYIKNNSTETTINVPLHINTLYPISKRHMKHDMSDVIILSETGEIIDWYFDNINHFGEFDIFITLNLQPDEDITLSLIFGNSDIISIGRKLNNEIIQKITINEYYSKLSVYTKDLTQLSWNIVDNYLYIDTTGVGINDIIYIENNSLEGILKNYNLTGIETTPELGKIQDLKPAPPITENIICKITNKNNCKYYMNFNVENKENNIINGPVYIKLNKIDLINKNILHPSFNNIELTLLGENDVETKLNYFIEDEDKFIKVWFNINNIAPYDNIPFKLKFHELNNISNNSNSIIDFSDNFIQLKDKIPYYFEKLDDDSILLHIKNNPNLTPDDYIFKLENCAKTAFDNLNIIKQ